MARTVILSRRGIRKGIALVELLASVAVTTLLIGGMGLFTVKMWEEMAAARCRDGVAHWASGVMEQAQNPNREQTLDAFVNSLKLPDHLARHMVQPRVTPKLTPVPDQPLLRRLDLEVKWSDANGSPAGPVLLSTLLTTGTKEGAKP